LLDDVSNKVEEKTFDQAIDSIHQIIAGLGKGEKKVEMPVV